MSYLRVKNWSDHQHYKDRRPPWIKLHARVLDSGDDFMALSEQEQWQLVRLWLVAARSDRFTEDGSGTVVPVVVNDEGSLRRSTMTLRRIPLAKFLTGGWLVRVPAGDVFTLDADGTRLLAHDASAVLAHGASALGSAGANAREPEVSEVSEVQKNQDLGLAVLSYVEGEGQDRASAEVKDAIVASLDAIRQAKEAS